MQRKITLLFIITSILVMVTGCVTINLESSNEKETSKVEDVQSSEKNDSNKNKLLIKMKVQMKIIQIKIMIPMKKIQISL